MSEEIQKQWYIVQTYSGYENKAKLALEERIRTANLQHLFDEIFIPIEMVTEIRNGKKRQTPRKLYNSYIFVKMALNDNTWHLIKDTPKIVGFVGNQKTPVPVPEHEVKKINDTIEESKLKTKTAYAFHQGDKIRVIEGNFKDFMGIVEEVHEEKEKIRVFVEIFGRPTSVEFDFQQVITVEE